MKKQIVFVLLAISLPAIAQKTPGYFSMRGGAAFLEEGPKGTGHMSFGISPGRTIGVGIGIGIVHIDKLYAPITADISYFGKPKKISPIVVGSIGYGFYNNASPYSTTKGGFTGSLNAGIALPARKSTKFFLMGGYSIYSFSGGRNISTPGYTYKAKDNIQAFTITLGVKV